jgi:prephenate dehydrogenase
MSSHFTIAIWGVGLIGGSLGMAWRRAGVASQVIGIGRRPLDEAVHRGAIDRYSQQPEIAIAQADLLVLGAPVQTIIAQAERFASFVKPGAIVTDVGSTKAQIVKAWEAHLPQGASFVGGHPMFGREVAGVEHASAELPKGCRYVLTPGDRATAEAVAQMTRFAAAAGGEVRIMTPAQHDARVAVASHLPQLVATALAAGAMDAEERMGDALDLAASGFRDTTRIASSPAELWTDIFLTNPEAIRAALLIFREALDGLEEALQSGDGERIRAIFARAHQARAQTKR